MDEAELALSSSDLVEYNSGKYIEFTPKTKTDIGVIFYPGGKVEPESYSPLVKSIAESGYKAVIVKMPFNLAVLSPNRARGVIESNPDIKHWYIAGHSLGGVMAASYAYNNPDVIEGLILLASYPQEKNDLSDSKIKTLSLCGSLDGLVRLDKIQETKELLPDSTKWVTIEGGNHSQMGWYGFQDGDNEALVTREYQQDIILESILDLINSK